MKSSIIPFKYCHGRTLKNELYVHEGLFMPNENLLMFMYVCTLVSPWGLIEIWNSKKRIFNGVIFFPNFDEGEPSIDFE